MTSTRSGSKRADVKWKFLQRELGRKWKVRMLEVGCSDAFSELSLSSSEVPARGQALRTRHSKCSYIKLRLLENARRGDAKGNRWVSIDDRRLQHGKQLCIWPAFLYQQ